MHSQLKRRQLPKLYSCMSKVSKEQLKNKALYELEMLDAKGIRRVHLPFHECLIMELKETGYKLASEYLVDILFDNSQIVDDDELGVVVDLRNKRDYLEYICKQLQLLEKQHDKGNLKNESLYLLRLAKYFSDKESGILWLAEKIYLASIAVSSQYLSDGGRQSSCCKFYYAKFLLDKFPGCNDEEPFNILTEVRNSAIGKNWNLLEEDESGPQVLLFHETAIELHNILLHNTRKLRLTDICKAERLARLAEKRARDVEDTIKGAEAIIEIGICQLKMNNFKNAKNSFERALKLYQDSKHVEGICDAKMHYSAVMQRLGEYEKAGQLLTEMGILAMEHGLRRHLGQALHLLGELHLKSGKPELGTQHLSEAFACFMGYNFNMIAPDLLTKNSDRNKTRDITCNREKYLKEAEQSRLMTAISAGQELMMSYFDQIREASRCNIAKIKTIEWKLNKVGWWVHKLDDDLITCRCAKHNRNPLDVLRLQLEPKNKTSKANVDINETNVETQDSKKNYSSYISKLFES